MSDAFKVWDLHKSIYRHLKKRAKSLEGEVSPELKSYERNQRKYANRKFTTSGFRDLIDSIRQSHLVFLGDFHSFDQNTRNLERLTRELIRQKDKFSLGVELVHEKHQKAIEKYLSRSITEIEFLEEIQYHESWRFPWVYYRPFFEMARLHNLSVVALNSDGNLEERDQRAAELLGDFISENPDERLLVLFGELHIVPNKLPHRVQMRVGHIIDRYKQTIIHQNLDEVYWKLHETNIEKHNQIVKFSTDEYSLQTAPPWIKYESMIYWYENLSDDPEFEIHDYIVHDGVLNLHSNVPENFLFLCEKIQKTLDLDEYTNFRQEEVEDFNIYEHQKLNIVLDKIGRLPKSSLSTFYKRLLTEGRVFRIPYSNNYYCSSYSINRMSFLAGLHLQDIIIRKQNINYEELWMNNDTFSKYVLILKQNALGYLSSKIINPFRKCDLYLDFKEKDKTLPEKHIQRPVYQSLVKLIESDGTEKFNSLLEKNSLFHAYECARKLGFYWGEILYENFLIKGRVEFKEILNFLLNDKVDHDSYYTHLRWLVPQADYPNQKKRYF